MPIRVKTPDGGTATFPDDMDPAAITAALAKRFPKPKAEPAKDPGSMADLLPNVGGAIGGFLGRRGGTPGAMALSAIGGAAGEGYKQLAKHAGEIPGALADVARNTLNPETRGATWRGAVEGATEGRTNALKAGGEQALLTGGGRAVAGGLGLGSRGLGVINANPVVNVMGQPVRTANVIRNAATVLGGATGYGSGPAEAVAGGYLARNLANPTTLRIGERALDLGSQGSHIYEQLLRALNASTKLPEGQ